MNNISRKKFKGIFIALIMGVALVLSPICVKADANPVLELTSSSGMSEIANEVNTVSRDSGVSFNFISFSTKQVDNVSKCVVTIDMVDYNSSSVTTTQRQDIMKTALESVNKNRSISSQSRTRLYNFISSQDTATSSLVRQLSDDVNADFATAYGWFKPFSGGISTFLGFLSLVIFVMLAMMIIIDLAYLTIPGFRYLLEKTDSNEKPHLVSNEAFTAVKEAEKDTSTYKSYMSLYLKHKTGQVILLAICLVYLVGGKIYILVGWLIDVIQQIIS